MVRMSEGYSSLLGLQEGLRNNVGLGPDWWLYTAVMRPRLVYGAKKALDKVQEWCWEVLQVA